MITRIRELLEARQLSPTQFADLIGVGRPVMSHILSERNKPSLEVVQKIISAFPDISLPWLLAGTGPMLAAAATSPVVPPAPIATEAVPTPVAVAPAVAVAAPTPTIAQPTAPFRSASASPASTYPQPLKFRPGTAGSTAQASAAATPTSQRWADENSSTTPKSPEVSASMLGALPTPAVPPAMAEPAGFPAPSLVAISPAATSAVVASAQAPALPPAPVPAPLTVSSTLGDLTTPAAEVSAPLTSPEPPATAANPAAALSFLGEPGKAIRRIVIFYRDGSFSDFLPEAS